MGGGCRGGSVRGVPQRAAKSSWIVPKSNCGPRMISGLGRSRGEGQGRQAASGSSHLPPAPWPVVPHRGTCRPGRYLFHTRPPLLPAGGLRCPLRQRWRALVRGPALPSLRVWGGAPGAVGIVVDVASGGCPMDGAGAIRDEEVVVGLAPFWGVKLVSPSKTNEGCRSSRRPPSPRGCHKDAHPFFFLLWHPLSDVWWLPTAIGYPPTAIGYPPTAIGYPPAAIVGRIGPSEFFFFITAPPALPCLFTAWFGVGH